MESDGKTIRIDVTFVLPKGKGQWYTPLLFMKRLGLWRIFGSWFEILLKKNVCQSACLSVCPAYNYWIPWPILMELISRKIVKIYHVLPDLEELCFFTKFTFARISCLIACASFHFALIQNPDWQMNVSKGSFLKNKLSNLKRFDEILKVWKLRLARSTIVCTLNIKLRRHRVEGWDWTSKLRVEFAT